MTIVEVIDLPRYIAWADGSLPLGERLESILLPEFQGKLQNRPSEKDQFYLTTLERTMRTNYSEKTKSESKSEHDDIYILAPAEHPHFPHQYNPIRDEVNFMNNRKYDYRLLFMVHHDYEPGVIREIFFDTLTELKFDIKPDNTYKNLPSFKKFLHDLSEKTVVDPYYAPSIPVEDDLEELGFIAKSESL